MSRSLFPRDLLAEIDRLQRNMRQGAAPMVCQSKFGAAFAVLRAWRISAVASFSGGMPVKGCNPT